MICFKIDININIDIDIDVDEYGSILIDNWILIPLFFVEKHLMVHPWSVRIYHGRHRDDAGGSLAAQLNSSWDLLGSLDHTLWL